VRGGKGERSKSRRGRRASDFTKEQENEEADRGAEGENLNGDRQKHNTSGTVGRARFARGKKSQSPSKTESGKEVEWKENWSFGEGKGREEKGSEMFQNVGVFRRVAKRAMQAITTRSAEFLEKSS